MRLITTLIFIFLLYSSVIFSQEKHKVVFYNYNEFNSRITTIFSSDTLIITQSSNSDSIYYYESFGYFNIKMKVNTKLKTATYENGFYDEDGNDENSRNEIRNSFEVKYIDNKNFEYNDKKILVYRLLVFNKKVNESAVLVFWTKDFGIIMQKDLYVNSLIRFDYANNEQKNKTIHHLCYFVFSDAAFNNLKDWKEFLK
ncbi:MAG: hypothetical protein IPM71_15670 [Bacteroidota bacterium]|nr:MAG: hypothetical protein IPM71_15670 [Bacteroidota bacterium]